MAIGRLYEVVVDCPEPRALADFYAELTGLSVLFEDDDWVTLGHGRDVRLAFQRVADYRPPAWPDPERPQQLHLDVFVDNVDAAEIAVVALGAQVLHRQEDGSRVCADPTGHPFCLSLDAPDAP